MADESHSDFTVPLPLIRALEESTGARVSRVESRAGTGASRDGASLVLEYPDGTDTAAYLTYDMRRNMDPERQVSYRREVAVLRALAGTPVRTARLLACDDRYLALLTENVCGDSNFNLVTQSGDRRALATDFMSQLAALHRLSIQPEHLPGFQSEEPASTRILARLSHLRAQNLATAPDSLILLALDWLEENVPSNPIRSVLLHGDGGPGNFLYEGQRVTALLDWELTHFGDPMEDLAMVCNRSLIQRFVPMRAAFEAYEAAGGAKVDFERVRYHRLYTQLGFIVATHASLWFDGAPAPAVYGTSLVYYTVHMRAIAESLAEMMGIAVPEINFATPPPSEVDRSFDMALQDLQDVIVPRLSDGQAIAKAKGLARLVKWWRATEQYDNIFVTAERDELSEMLGTSAITLEEGRAALRQAILDRLVEPSKAISYLYRCVMRDVCLRAEAMGTYAQTRPVSLD